MKTKRAFKMKLKAFFINFKWLSLKQIKINFFGRWESDFEREHTFLKNSVFPSTIIKLSKLDHNIRIYISFNICRKSIVKFIIPSAKSFFDSYNPKGVKFITRLQLGLSCLQEKKIKYAFENSLNLFCNCGLNIELTTR